MAESMQSLDQLSTIGVGVGKSVDFDVKATKEGVEAVKKAAKDKAAKKK